MGEQGRFSLDLYDEMLSHVEQYRELQAAAAEGAAAGSEEAPALASGQE